MISNCNKNIIYILTNNTLDKFKKEKESIVDTVMLNTTATNQLTSHAASQAGNVGHTLLKHAAPQQSSRG